MLSGRAWAQESLAFSSFNSLVCNLVYVWGLRVHDSVHQTLCNLYIQIRKDYTASLAISDLGHHDQLVSPKDLYSSKSSDYCTDSADN